MALAPAPRPETGLAKPGGALASLSGLSDAASRFTAQPAIRRALPSILLLVAAAVLVLTWLAVRETPRSALYPGLAEAEKAQVVEVLNGAGLAATIDQATGEITVPSADYHRARLALAAQGLPQSVPDGNRVLTDMPMGASRALETARLRQAQELDLARSITEIGSVQAARVHLALPEKSAFLRDSHPPRASVFLTLAAGRVLDAGQVEAIVHLVSSSVPGMSRADVSVVDHAGRLLSRDSTDPQSQLGDRQTRQRAELEDMLRNRVSGLLTPLLGPGNFSVEVTAAMDFTQREITEERVDPTGSALRSEQVNESENRDAPAGGIPGAVANTPPDEATLEAQAPEAAGAASTLRSRTAGSTRNYEISRMVETIRPETGSITRLTAAVVLRTPPPAEGEAPPAFPEERLSDLRRLVETAIGFDKARGDDVVILAQPFAIPELVTDPVPVTDYSWVPGALSQAVLLAVIAIVGLGFVRPILMRQAAAATGTGFPGSPTMVEVNEGESLDDVEAKLDRRHRDLASSVLGANSSRAEKQAVLRQLVNDDPQRIAQVFHRILKPELDTQR